MRRLHPGHSVSSSTRRIHPALLEIALSVIDSPAARVPFEADVPASSIDRRMPLDAHAPLSSMLPELRLMTGLLIAAAIVAALYFGRDIVVPLALAVLLGFVLDPIVTRLRRWGVPRAGAVGVVMVATCAVLALVGVFLMSQIGALSEQLPTYQDNIRTKIASLREQSSRPGMFDGAVSTFNAVRDEVDRATVPLAPDAQRQTVAPVSRVELTPREHTPLQQLEAFVEAASGPLASAGITVVFAVLILLDRFDLRDRVLRLWGSDSLHRSTDALDEAGRRISKYLTMQVVVNLSYGVPMATGLWVIGVPGSVLWGALAALMRFVPYVGPMISAVFPLVLAFAVEPSWTMLLWTLVLIVTLELLVNNLVEPLLYGASTGLSAVSLIVSATFWTALWGPVGLIMSTPLTVCLLVIGRYLPRLAFLDVLLGSQPALDTPTRIYQRLLAGDIEEAIELANVELQEADVATFYSVTAVPVLQMASVDHSSRATAAHRHRLVTGMDALLRDVVDQHAPGQLAQRAAAVVMGGKWEVDTLSARMLVHALALAGHPAEHRAIPAMGSDALAQLDLRDVETVCINYFTAQPQIQARNLCRRIRRKWPHIHIVLGLWNAPAELLTDAACRELGADAVVASISEALDQVLHLAGARPGEAFLPAEIPASDVERVAALHASGALDPRARALFDVVAKRAADVFAVPLVVVSLIDAERQHTGGAFGSLASDTDPDSPALRGEDMNVPRAMSISSHVVAHGKSLLIADIARDMRFAHNPVILAKSLRFYAGAPLCDDAGHVIGTLCLLDRQPRRFDLRELHLLEALAADLMTVLGAQASQWQTSSSADIIVKPASATVGQWVPNN